MCGRRNAHESEVTPDRNGTRPVRHRRQCPVVVTDPGNLAQSIINMSDNIAHTSKTAVNTADSFAETVKIYEQAKKYYDQLKAVND